MVSMLFLVTLVPVLLVALLILAITGTGQKKPSILNLRTGQSRQTKNKLLVLNALLGKLVTKILCIPRHRWNQPSTHQLSVPAARTALSPTRWGLSYVGDRQRLLRDPHQGR